MYKRDAKYEITLTGNLITKAKYYYKYLIKLYQISKDYSFIICDIRMTSA